MTALLLQTFLLMVPAFLLGASLACGLRRLMKSQPLAAELPARVPASAVDPLPQYAARDTTVAPALQTPSKPAAAAPIPAPSPAAVSAPVAKPIPATPVPAIPTPAASRFDDTLKARPSEVRAPLAPIPPAAAQPTAARPVPPPPAAPATVTITPAVSKPATATVPSADMIAGASAAMAAAAAAVAAQAAAAVTKAPAATAPKSPPNAAPAPPARPVATAPAQPVPAPTPAPAPAATTIVTPPLRDAVLPPKAPLPSADDLTRISAIEPSLAQQLAKLGTNSFKQIAAWRKTDVDSLSQALGFQGRIEQENWIEQAQILAGGGETFYSARHDKNSAPAATKPPLPASSTAPAPAVPMAPARPPVSLPEVERRAAFSDTTPRPPVTPATVPPIAAPVAAPVTAAATPPPTASVVPPAPAAATAQAAAAAASTATTRPAADPVPSAATMRPTVVASRDNLQRIGVVNAEIEKLLSAQGIARYAHIAGWSTSEIERFDRLLGSQGRIGRENWVEQAQILAKGGDTAHSREYDRRAATNTPQEPAARPKNITEAIKANAGAAATAAAAAASIATAAGKAGATAASVSSRPDIAGLRSVRSDAYKSATDAATAAVAAAAAGSGSARVVRSAEVDDLKRIRGVGVLIEKRLNSLGIVSYAQIADWTTVDIDRVSASLDFKGRIERENWVEQARILAAGGQTEFSRRVDRGEVETSKSR